MVGLLIYLFKVYNVLNLLAASHICHLIKNNHLPEEYFIVSFPSINDLFRHLPCLKPRLDNAISIFSTVQVGLGCFFQVDWTPDICISSGFFCPGGSKPPCNYMLNASGSKSIPSLQLGLRLGGLWVSKIIWLGVKYSYSWRGLKILLI